MHKNIRTMIELAYRYCWGKNGSADLRDEFNVNYKQLQTDFEIGQFSFNSNGQFTWYN